MPLTLEIPARELFDEKELRFFYSPRTVLKLEHSLISLSEWESKWKRPYLVQPVLTEEANRKSPEEEMDYIRCMTMNHNPVDPSVYKALSAEELNKIRTYINDTMSATTVKERPGQPPNREIVTSEVIYAWMTILRIPFRPAETWHLNRLMKLIEVVSSKQEPPKNMPRAESMRRRHSINSARRAAYMRRH